MSTFLFVASLPVLIALVALNLESPAVSEWMVRRSFSNWSYGTLCVKNFDGKIDSFGVNKASGLSAGDAKAKCNNMLVMNEPEAWLLFTRATTGIGEAYMNGLWDVGEGYDLGDLMTLIFWNNALNPTKMAWVLKWVRVWQWSEWWERYTQSKVGQKEKDNIDVAYFDTPFFERMLDGTMQYTCAIWNNKTTTLYEAEVNKARFLLQKARVEPQHRVLDIGSGWGFLANEVNKIYGADSWGITIAKAQYASAMEKFAKGNERVNYKLLDYRDAVGEFGVESFDRILSVGMVAHLGTYYFQFFQNAYDMLKPGGYFIVQGVLANDIFVTADRDFTNRNVLCQRTSFLAKYIFPGGCLLTSDWVLEAALKAGFVAVQRESISQHYSRTLRKWRDSMYEHREWIIKNYSLRNFRMYEIYLCFCEGAYRMGWANKVQFTLFKPEQPDFHARPFAEYSWALQHPTQLPDKRIVAFEAQEKDQGQQKHKQK
jgi:cyclopropane-fatty-acyl-phospholipid synthase